MICAPNSYRIYMAPRAKQDTRTHHLETMKPNSSNHRSRFVEAPICLNSYLRSYASRVIFLAIGGVAFTKLALMLLCLN